MNNYTQEKEHIINETLKLLAEKYPIGLYEYLFKYQPEMYKELRDLENDISRDYDHKSIYDIKAIMRKYWILHSIAIKEFENQDNLDLEVSEVKQQIQQELHTV